MTNTIVVIGGSAAGMGAAGAAKQVDPDARVVVFTELQDVAYSPCGIPYVHGKEIDSFDRLILQGKDHYEAQGYEIHYETVVSAIDPAAHTVEVPGQAAVRFDRLIIGTGFQYERPDIPGGDLDGLYYVRDIRAAQRWDEVLDTVKRAVIAEAQPIGVEMATALAHRGIETHLVDPHPWAMAEIADPDIMAPVEESWRELGVHIHLNTRIKAFLRHRAGPRRQDLRRGDPGRHGRDRREEAAQQPAGRAGRDQARLHRRDHRRRAHADLGRRRLRRRRLRRGAAGHDGGAGPGPVRQPCVRAGQGRRQRRGRQAAQPTRRSTCRGAWSAASG